MWARLWCSAWHSGRLRSRGLSPEGDWAAGSFVFSLMTWPGGERFFCHAISSQHARRARHHCGLNPFLQLCIWLPNSSLCYRTIIVFSVGAPSAWFPREQPRNLVLGKKNPHQDRNLSTPAAGASWTPKLLEDSPGKGGRR